MRQNMQCLNTKNVKCKIEWQLFIAVQLFQLFQRFQWCWDVTLQENVFYISMKQLRNMSKISA